MGGAAAERGRFPHHQAEVLPQRQAQIGGMAEGARASLDPYGG
jgi:hypothetical protein